jgi:hypothetical protein
MHTSQAMSEAIWIVGFLGELGFFQPRATVISTENKWSISPLSGTHFTIQD